MFIILYKITPIRNNLLLTPLTPLTPQPQTANTTSTLVEKSNCFNPSKKPLFETFLIKSAATYIPAQDYQVLVTARTSGTRPLI